MRRRFLSLALGCLAAAAMAGGQQDARAERRVLLVPLDDRPATTQFAQMIGELAGVTVETPPAELLGRFTQPGRPEQIIEWLGPRMAGYEAVILNTDMIAYGGLIASRTDRTSYNLAIKRLRDWWRIRKTAPGTRVYAFSTLMRLAPTATRTASKWRLDLARYVELREAHRTSGDKNLLQSLKNLKERIPAGEIERYDVIRDRDHRIQQELVRMTNFGVFDYAVFGQDDARPTGPHVPETARLKAMATNLGVRDRTTFAEGIDQIGNLLLSRALVQAAQWSPVVRVVYADEAGRQKVAFYESDTIDNSLMEQIASSGARVARQGESFDYSLYVNTPDPREFALDAFLGSLKSEVDQGMPVAVADVNLGSSGTGDERVFRALTDEGRSSRVLAYAGWNTAGNTMGTTIPAANVYLLARKLGVDPVRREVALRAFILHRLVNDFEYHKYVRPLAYKMLDSTPGANREETYGSAFDQVDEMVREDLGSRLQQRFKEQLQGTRFFAGNRQYEVERLTDVQIKLPWPRAYEVKLDFKIEVAQTKGTPTSG
ncbi:MAG: DUF4127 family protein [Fimbriimonadaceae bacterium]|nr:DUF4127 family protein [Fimbriimonadaceae bacterium]QYK56856.1 MAG: DUF4127 family protein [Fimbriimonadaceae bacterium]